MLTLLQLPKKLVENIKLLLSEMKAILAKGRPEEAGCQPRLPLLFLP